MSNSTKLEMTNDPRKVKKIMNNHVQIIPLLCTPNTNSKEYHSQKFHLSQLELAGDLITCKAAGSNIYTSMQCNAFDWDTVEYATRHLYFPYTHEPLVTSGMFHGIPRESIA